jgi:hypothetical protein
MGTISFYRKFIGNLASLSSPLTDLLKKEAKEPLIWSDEQIRAFENLKAKLYTAPVLKLPDTTKPFVLRTDTSKRGIGSVSLQYVDNVPMPVAYASRKLLPRKQNYAAVEVECLALVWAIEKFRVYLFGKEFLIECDYMPLSHLQKFKNNNIRLMRWALALQEFNFRVVYIAGSENVGADMLSRLPIP